MKESHTSNNVDLDSLKSLIIDQEVLLTTYTDQWELLYSDLATCVKIMVQIEKKQENQEAQSIK